MVVVVEKEEEHFFSRREGIWSQQKGITCEKCVDQQTPTFLPEPECPFAAPATRQLRVSHGKTSQYRSKLFGWKRMSGRISNICITKANMCIGQGGYG